MCGDSEQLMICIIQCTSSPPPAPANTHTVANTACLDDVQLLWRVLGQYGLDWYVLRQLERPWAALLQPVQPGYYCTPVYYCTGGQRSACPAATCSLRRLLREPAPSCWTQRRLRKRRALSCPTAWLSLTPRSTARGCARSSGCWWAARPAALVARELERDYHTPGSVTGSSEKLSWAGDRARQLQARHDGHEHAS